MNLSSEPAETLQRIEGHLKEVFPTGDLQKPNVTILDRNLSLVRAESLVDRLADETGLLVEGDQFAQGDRVFRVYMGLPSGPSWIEFNRESPNSKRLEIAKKRMVPLTYLLLRLSRVGPFYSAEWNSIIIRSGAVMPVAVEFPADPEWVTTFDVLTRVLSNCSLSQLEEPLLSKIPSAFIVESHTGTAYNRVTLFESLLYEVP